MSLRLSFVLRLAALILVGIVGTNTRGQTAPAAPPAPAQPTPPVPPASPSAPGGSSNLPAASSERIPSFDEIKNQQDLDRVVMQLDTELFDAYNRCDLDKFRSMIADDVEFYHDQGGITRGKDALTDSIKKNICPTDTHRELVPGSFQAHYMKGFGAIEIGTHRFLHPKSGGGTGEGRFITLWQYKERTWKVTRALSFDHHLASEASAIH